VDTREYIGYIQLNDSNLTEEGSVNIYLVMNKNFVLKRLKKLYGLI